MLVGAILSARHNVYLLLHAKANSQKQKKKTTKKRRKGVRRKKTEKFSIQVGVETCGFLFAQRYAVLTVCKYAVKKSQIHLWILRRRACLFVNALWFCHAFAWEFIIIYVITYDQK